MEIIYSDLAREDLRAILKYGHQHWGANAAYDFIIELEKNFQLLTQSPQAGRRVENPYLSNNASEHRTFPFGNYQVLYEVMTGRIVIHGIIPKDRPRTR